MMPQNMEMLYTTVVMVDDLNRQYRDEMMRQAAHARLVRQVRDQRRTLARTVLAWTGRRLVASGHYLLRRADRPATEISLAFEQQ